MNHYETKEPTQDKKVAVPNKTCGVVDVSQAENDDNAVASKSFPSERANLDLTQFSNSTADASRVLLFLGSTLRSKADKFIDASTIPDPRGNSRRPQGKELFFPDRLYQLLELSEKHGWTDIVSFQPHGRSFRVHDKAAFVARLLPICLQGQGSWSSFLRQLRLYGFTRCESGPDYGAYYHELFLRDRPSLTRYMRRVGVSHGGLDRRTFRLQKGEDPDFYHAYAPMPPLHTSNESH
jgi:HSF-type DNA-binding